MPSDFVGEWSGDLREGSSVYPVFVSLSEGEVGQPVGVARYPTYPCVGTLRLLEVVGVTRIRMLETTTEGTCAATTEVRLNFAADGTLNMSLVSTADSVPYATGVLTRPG
jgi:hypothetical protein